MAILKTPDDMCTRAVQAHTLAGGDQSSINKDSAIIKAGGGGVDRLTPRSKLTQPTDITHVQHITQTGLYRAVINGSETRCALFLAFYSMYMY